MWRCPIISCGRERAGPPDRSQAGFKAVAGVVAGHQAAQCTAEAAMPPQPGVRDAIGPDQQAGQG